MTHISGYGLLYRGAPLCVYRSSSDSCCYEHYVLDAHRGVPYLVDIHTMRHYLSYRRDRGWCPQHAPEDGDGLLQEARPCYLDVIMQKGDPRPGSSTSRFTLEVTTLPLIEPLTLYKVLPPGCLDDTRSGPIEGTHIKVLHYTPDYLGGQYVYDDCCHVDTYIGPSGTGVHHYLFRREQMYPIFHETFELGPVLGNGIGD